MLHEFLSSHREEIIVRAKALAALRLVPTVAEAELADGVPPLVDQLIAAIKGLDPDNEEMVGGATRRGGEMLRQGFSVSQVVYGYGDLCQAVTELAVERSAPIAVGEFQRLNQCLDDSIAGAVTEYGRGREQSLVDDGTERLGALAHELRNHINTATLSFGILKTGTAPIGGSTGAVLERSLRALADLIDVALAEVRVESHAQRSEEIELAGFLEDIEIAAVLQAKAGGHQLTVAPVPPGTLMIGDRQLLLAAVANLVQNAFKFTAHSGHIRLRTRVAEGRVTMEVEDECGGLPPGRSDTMFRPFSQLGADRSGIGLGLSISQKAVQLNGGEIRVQNLPGRGCIFTVDLPTHHRAAE